MDQQKNILRYWKNIFYFFNIFEGSIGQYSRVFNKILKELTKRILYVDILKIFLKDFRGFLRDFKNEDLF